MAQKKKNNYKESDEKSLRQQVQEKQKELFTARMDHVRGMLKNPRSLKMLRKSVAQLKTALREQELRKESK